MASDAALQSWAQTPAAQANPARWREVLFVTILLVCWITTKPFGAFQSGDPSAGAPDLVNQLIFAGLALAALTALWFTDWRMLRPLAQPSYALLMVWLIFSGFVSAEPADSLRALAFTLIAMLLAVTLYVLPDNVARFRALLVLGAATALAVAWIGVFTIAEAVHADYDPFEPEHAGSWRGQLTHKNIAGAMMGVLAIIGIYALRSGQRLIGIALLFGAVVFLWFTRSKTSFGLLPFAIMVGFLVEWLRNPILRAGLLIGPIASLNLLTLGSTLDPTIRAFNQAFIKDPSFTGRFDIWRFAFERLVERPWTGFGFEGFWLSDLVKNAESRLELAWQPQNIVHGHNAYLDVALTLGIPGLIITVWVFIFRPVIDFHRCRDLGAEVRPLAGMCIMLWLFISLGMCLEVFYFRRADPIWFALLIAVLGLRFLSTMPVRQGGKD